METKYKVIIIVLISYILIVILTVFIYNSMHIKNYLVLSTNDIYEYKNGTMEKVSLSSISQKKFQYYINGKKIGTYKTQITDHVIVNSDNPELVAFSNPTILGLPEKNNMPVYTMTQEKLNATEEQEVVNFLAQQGITEYDGFSELSKITYENKGETKKIYLVSNAFSEETHDQVFSFIIEQSGLILYKNIVNNGSLMDVCIPFVNNLVDWNQDQQVDLIIGCQYFDQLGSIYDFLEMQEGIYQSILK